MMLFGCLMIIKLSALEIFYVGLSIFIYGVDFMILNSMNNDNGH